MVRNLAGTLIEAGRGNIEDVTSFLAFGPYRAPPRGYF